MGDMKEIRGWMGVPLIVRDELIGFMAMDNHEYGVYGEQEIALVRPFADQAAQAIANAQLHEQIHQYAEELEERVRERTENLTTLVNAMSGREVRMANLKKVIEKLRQQLFDAGIEPVTNDPLLIS